MQMKQVRNYKDKEVVKMLIRHDPFDELDRLTQSFWPRAIGQQTAMPLDAYKRGDEFIVQLDIPGVDPEKIEVTVERDTLTVSAERLDHRQENDEPAVSERLHGKFSRQLFLGEALDADKLEAKYEYGVLTLVIPIAQSAKPKKIPVRLADVAIEAKAS
jgi:HSP20 family protein